MTRMKERIVRWAAREAQYAPLYALLILHFPARRWYWSLLDAQADRIHWSPEAAVELFRGLPSKWWVRKALHTWLAFQRGRAYAALNRFGEATADFKRLPYWHGDAAMRVDRIRKAIALLENDPSRVGWFEMRAILGMESIDLVPERVELIVECAQRREQEAAAQEGDVRIWMLRKAYASFHSVRSIAEAPIEWRHAALRGEVSSALALGDWKTAYQVCHYHDTVLPDLWRSTLAMHTRFFPREVVPYYTQFARNVLLKHEYAPLRPEATPVDLFCWLVNMSRSFCECGRPTAAEAALTLASVHKAAFMAAPPASRWNVLEPERVELASPSQSIGAAKRLESIVESIAPAHVPPEKLDQLDILLLGTDTSGERSAPTILDAVEMLCEAGLSRTNAIAVCEKIVAPLGRAPEIEALREEMKSELRVEGAQRSVPSGYSVETTVKIAELLLALNQPGKKRSAIREVLEEIGEYVMDVAPVENRIQHLVWLASISASYDCGTNAESCLHAARSACMQYENPSVRLPLMLSLCHYIRGSGLTGSFGAFYKSVAMEGRVLASTTWINASGYYEKERDKFKDLQRQFEDIV